MKTRSFEGDSGRNCSRAPLVAALLAVGSLWGATAAQAQSHLVRLGDDSAGSVKRVEVATLGDELAIAAVQDGAGNLKLIAYEVNAKGNLTRRGSFEAGPASVFAITALSPFEFVTAVQQEDGTLKLIDWFIDPLGLFIFRRGSITAGSVNAISLATVGQHRVVTLTKSSSNQAKLIVWDVSGAGDFTRRGDHTVSDATRVGVAALSARRVACAVRRTRGTLEVTAWSLSDPDHPSQLGTAASGPKVTEIAITNTAVDRAVTAVRLSDGTLQVDAWDVEGQQGPKNASSANAGAADHIALAAVGSTKVVTAVRQADQTLKLITWQVVDTIHRLDDISAGTVGRTSVTTLGWDHIVTAIQDDQNDLKLIAWADFSIGMLHGSWKPTSFTTAPTGRWLGPREPQEEEEKEQTAAEKHWDANPWPEPVVVAGASDAGPAESQPGLPKGPSPAPSLTFLPEIQGVDAMIAVGKDYVIVTQDHYIEFLYKKGANAGQKLAGKNGENLSMSADSFFATFLASNKPSGGVNHNNINRHLRFPPRRGDSKLECTDVTGASGDPCMNEFYDTRVHYDNYAHRFVILSAVRGANIDGVTDDVARRYFAIAVSKSEDPRDGFEQWITTESNYSDWPRVGVGDGVLVVAHNACKNPDNSDPCGDGDHTSVVNNTRALRPMLYAFRTADMSAGHKLIDNWKVYPYQIGGGSIFPVQHHGDTGGWTYALKPNDTLLDGYRFEKSFGTLPTLNSTTGIVFGGLSGYRESIHFHGGNLYLASGIKQADRFPNLFPERWDVRGLKLPIIEGSGNSWAIGLCPGTPGCLDFSFGTRAAGDGADDLWSYEMPSMAVNDNGDMAIIFGRVPVVVPSGKGQEARYTLYYDDSRGLQGSRVLHEGDTVLKDKFCSGGVQDAVATAENYWHIWYGGDGCDTQSHYQDYGTAVADPEGNFWFAHSFADSTFQIFRMVGGKVEP